MPVEIDGFAVLAAIGRNASAFPAVKAEAVKAARSFVGKQLKDKAVGLAELRSVAGAIGAEAFDLIADGLSDAEIKSLLSRVDRHNAALKQAAVADQRRSVSALAQGAAEPAMKSEPVKAAKAPRKEQKSKVERSASSRAMRARRRV